MSSTNFNLREDDVVRLVLEFLHNRDLHITQLSLERETGVINGNFSDDMLFIRQLILDGLWDDVLEYVQPLNALEDFEADKFTYTILRQKFIELVCIRSEIKSCLIIENVVDEVVKVLRDLQKLAPSNEDYSNLCLLLTLPCITDHAQFKTWNPSNARVQCFQEVYPLVEKFMPCDKKPSGVLSKCAKNDRLMQLLIKGILYESCVNYCQAKATGSIDAHSNEISFSRLLDGTGFGKSDLSLLSWLQSIPAESFSVPFEQRLLNVDVEKLERPSLQASWTEHMLVKPIKPHTFPHMATTFKRPHTAAGSMTRSLRPHPDGSSPSHLAAMTLSAIDCGPSSSCFAGFHLTGMKGSKLMNASVDRLFESKNTDSYLPDFCEALLRIDEQAQSSEGCSTPPRDNGISSAVTSNVTTPEHRGQDQNRTSAIKTASSTNTIPTSSNLTTPSSDIAAPSKAWSVASTMSAKIPSDSEPPNIGSTINDAVASNIPTNALKSAELAVFGNGAAPKMSMPTANGVGPHAPVPVSNNNTLPGNRQLPGMAPAVPAKMHAQSPKVAALQLQETGALPNNMGPQITSGVYSQNAKLLQKYQIQKQRDLENAVRLADSRNDKNTSGSEAEVYQHNTGLERNSVNNVMSGPPVSPGDDIPDVSNRPTFKRVTVLEDLQAIRCAEFHPSGNIYAVGSNSKTLRICSYPEINDMRDYPEQPAPPTVLLKRTKHHKGSIYCLAWSPAGDLIATGSNDKAVKMMKFNSQMCNLEGQEMELTMHDGTVRDVCFMEDTSNRASLLLSAGTGDCRIYVTDCATGNPFQALGGHSGHVLSLYTWGGAMFVSGSQDKSIRFWDLRTGGCVNVITPSVLQHGNPNRSSGVSSVAVDPSGRLLVSGHDNGSCVLYDMRGARSLQQFMPHTGDVRSVRFSPGAFYLLTAGYDSKIVLTDLQGDLTCTLPSVTVARHSDKVCSTRWHPEDFSFLSTSADKTAVLWTIPPV